MSADNTERDARIVALAGKKSYRLIAQELGVTRGVISGVLSRHRRKTGERPSPTGRPAWKLTEQEAREIKFSSEPVKLMARRFHVSEGYIYKIRNGIFWRHVRMEAAE